MAVELIREVRYWGNVTDCPACGQDHAGAPEKGKDGVAPMGSGAMIFFPVRGANGDVNDLSGICEITGEPIAASSGEAVEGQMPGLERPSVTKPKVKGAR